MKAKALVFEAPKKVVLKDLDLPEPGPADLVVETEVSGISVGTERWAYIGKRPELKFPNVPGYMGIGRVTRAGDEAKRKGFSIGDRVNFFKSRLIGDLNGNSWMGSHLSTAIVDTTPRPDEVKPGEWEVHCCEKLPEGLDPVDASLTQLCAVAMRGIEMAGIPAASRVLVLGLGVIGQYAMQVCRLKGARVACADVVESRLQVAKKTGAEWVLNSQSPDFYEKLKGIAPSGFDIIIDTSSIPEVINKIFPHLKLYGKLIFQGWYPPPSALDLNAAHGRMPTMYAPCAHSGQATASAMQWVRDGHLDTKSLVSHILKPSQAPETYERMAAGSEDFLGMAFDWRHT